MIKRKKSFNAAEIPGASKKVFDKRNGLAEKTDLILLQSNSKLSTKNFQ
jgi:hypothetical protein